MSRTPRPIRIEGALAYIPLTKGYEAVIDAADVPLVSAWSWTAREKWRNGQIQSVYAYRMECVEGQHFNIMLHNVVCPPLKGGLTDHADNDGLNNRRSNLRPATFAENARNIRRPSHNTSGVKGVVWDKRERRWVARIKVNGVRREVGRSKCITAAALAYAKASRELHGEFGRVA